MRHQLRGGGGRKVQKPPTHRPSSRRATSIVPKLGAKAASRFEAISSVVSAISTVRRSSLPDATINAGPANAASTPGMVTIRPAVPSDTLSPRAMSVSRPMGMNSVETIAKVPTAMELTASHAERDAGTGAETGAGAARSSMHGLLLGEFIMGSGPWKHRRRVGQCW